MDSWQERNAVLLVDDAEATRILVRAILERDFDVDAVSDGSEAIEMLRTRRYAAVILDLKMPGVDGYAVLDFLRDTRPQLLPRVLVFTAAVSRKEISPISRYGVAGVIRKPFELEAFAEEVRRVVGGGGGPDGITDVLCSGSAVFIMIARLVPGEWLS